MTIFLIKKEEYKTLKRIQEKYPILTFEQKEPFTYIDKSKFTEDDKIVFGMITDILKKAIVGFREFNNFLFSKEKKELKIRFQYDWSLNTDANGNIIRDNGQPFTGVGYLFLDELLYGFREKSNTKNDEK